MIETSKCINCGHGICAACNHCHNLDCEGFFPASNKCFDQLLPAQPPDPTLSIVEEFRQAISDMKNLAGYIYFEQKGISFLLAALEEHGKAEYERGWKNNPIWHGSTVSMSNEMFERKVAAGFTEGVEKVREIIGEHNARILNEYQLAQLGDERILFAPIEKATKETLEALKPKQ